MNIKELFEGVEPELPGAPEGIQIMTPQQFIAKSAQGEEPEPEQEVDEDFKMKSDFSKETGDAVADFLNKGGKITQLPPNRVRVKPGQSLASKHIGSRSETGRIIGKDRKVYGNKPVVDVSEGKMAELDMDLEDPELSDREFEKYMVCLEEKPVKPFHEPIHGTSLTLEILTKNYTSKVWRKQQHYLLAPVN